MRKSQVTTSKAYEECGLGRWKLKEVQFDSLAHSVISLISKQHKEIGKTGMPNVFFKEFGKWLGWVRTMCIIS